jgi:hypothetical protein
MSTEKIAQSLYSQGLDSLYAQFPKLRGSVLGKIDDL